MAGNGAMSDEYTRAYLALCAAEEAEAPAYAAYLAAPVGTRAHDAAFAAWWPLREARDAARTALDALPIPTEETAPMMIDWTELYGYAVFGDADAILRRVTVGEIRQTYQYATLRQWLTWAAIDR